MVVTDGHHGAVAIGTAGDKHVIRTPSQVIDRRIVNVSDDSDRCLLVSGVDHDLVCRSHCENHPVGQVEQWHLVSIVRSRR